ncbi:MAG: nitroreductase family protein [Thermoproteota archaeon]|nr:MAG: nitroreductase family protein [Candidatus Korarchaeota archaeon]RLG46218.1 MAG: nitroreductase family protein [Candidatus Korarchaeota archaeon]
MDVMEAIFGRRSVRRFKTDPIPEEDLRKILEAAIRAPSAGNRQPWEFVVVRDPNRKQEIARAALGQWFIAEAPVVIVVCANEERSASRYGDRGRKLYCIQDTAAATQNMLLAAYSMGYGTCWVGAFDEGSVASIINAPRGVRPVAIIPIGIPAESPSDRGRIPLERVMHEETF